MKVETKRQEDWANFFLALERPRPGTTNEVGRYRLKNLLRKFENQGMCLEHFCYKTNSEIGCLDCNGGKPPFLGVCLKCNMDLPTAELKASESENCYFESGVGEVEKQHCKLVLHQHLRGAPSEKNCMGHWSL